MFVKAICKITAMAALAMIAASDAQAGKEHFERCKPHCNVGTIGNIDHSKTRVRQNGRSVRMPGFGTFEFKDRQARSGVSRGFRTLNTRPGTGTHRKPAPPSSMGFQYDSFRRR